MDHALVHADSALSGGNALNGHAWVPIDDENCMAWTMTFHPTVPYPTWIELIRDGYGVHLLIPGTTAGGQQDNDYLIDRNLQKSRRHYNGVKGLAMQDASVQESMGPIADRTKENLVSTDNAIILARSRLLKAASDVQQGARAPGLNPDDQLVRSATFVLPVDVPFAQARREDLTVRAGVPHTSI